MLSQDDDRPVQKLFFEKIRFVPPTGQDYHTPCAILCIHWLSDMSDGQCPTTEYAVLRRTINGA